MAGNVQGATRHPQRQVRRHVRWLAVATAVVLCAAGALFVAPPAGAATLGGVDVSHHQVDRSPIDWARVAAGGQRFVFVKATEGQTYTDPTFRASYAGIRASGMYRGAYHFASPDATAVDAVREAQHFVGVAGTFDTAGELPPVLDLESSGGLSSSALIAWARAFLTETERLTGRVPIIYTGPSFWRDQMGNSRAFTRYPLWIAHYTSSSPSLPGGWSKYTFWQNTRSQRVPGISGTVDHNIFGGSAGTLAALANGAGRGNPYRPETVCGPGYRIVDQHLLSAGGTPQGTVYLLYHGGTGNNCVVTLKAVQLGTTSPASVHLEVRGARPVTDAGRFAYYAGPVRAQAANRCVRWGGSVGSASYDSPFGHCG